MEDFNWHYGNFISEMETRAFRKFISTDSEYKELEYYLNKYSDNFLNILNKLNLEDKRFVKEYIDKQNHQASCCSNHLYLEGYNDCVKLLKKLRII